VRLSTLGGYRDAMTLDEAIDEVEANSGTQFSPAVVEALLRVLSEDPLTVGARGPRAVAAT
jgi:HD-GYP domain-containing protein (c-di-GMP phosphodiesterase class II)